MVVRLSFVGRHHAQNIFENLREGSKKKIFTFSRPWLLRGGSGDMSRPTKLFYGLTRGKKGPKMVLKSTKKSIENPPGLLRGGGSEALVQ